MLLASNPHVRCDALLLDKDSRTDTYPYVEVNEDDATISHEATVGKIGQDQIFYLMSRGFTESDALSLIVGGFMEPFTKELADGIRSRTQPNGKNGNGRLSRLIVIVIVIVQQTEIVLELVLELVIIASIKAAEHQHQ